MQTERLNWPKPTMIFLWADMCRLMQPTTSLSLLLLLALGIHVLIARIASTSTFTDWLRMCRRGRRESMRFSARSPGIGVQSNPWTPQIRFVDLSTSVLRLEKFAQKCFCFARFRFLLCLLFSVLGFSGLGFWFRARLFLGAELRRACKLLTIHYCPLQGLFILLKGRRNLLHGRISFKRDARHVCGLCVRRMRSFRGTRHGIFHAWRCWCMFSQLHKEHSKYCKILRKQRITDALEEAEQAAQRHDTWALYRIVRRLAPKVPSKKFQIQQKGKLLSPQEELQTMVTYYEELYADSQVSTTKYSGTLSEDFPVTVQELLYYLQQIPLRKAVSRGSVPGVVYRICAQALAPALCKLISIHVEH